MSIEISANVERTLSEVGFAIIDRKTGKPVSTGYHPQAKLYQNIGRARSANSSSVWTKREDTVVVPVYIIAQDIGKGDEDVDL